MISKTLRATTGRLTVTIPSQLSEVTLGMLIALSPKKGESPLTDPETIAVLSGLHIDEIYSILSLAKLQEFSEHILSLVHQMKYEYNADKVPRKIMGVTVNTDLSKQPVGPAWECKAIIQDEYAAHAKQPEGTPFSPSLQSCSLLLGHYLYCPLNPGKSYTVSGAEALASGAILTIPITEALPVAMAFFLNYRSLSKPKVSFWQALRLLWKNRQALKSSPGSGI